MEQSAERLGNRSGQIDKQIQELNQKIQRCLQEAKLPQNRGRAQQLRNQAASYLKRRKLLEQQQARVEGQRFNLDQLAYQQEQVQTNIDTVNAMKATTAVLKKQMKQISIEGVDDLMMDMEDMVADANEISDLLAGGIGGEIDEGELTAELDAWEDEGLDAGPVRVGGQAAAAGPDLGVSEFTK
jgi:charged multivesicular body protein 5